MTMVVEPRMLSRHPSFPCRFNRSVRKYDDSTALQQTTLQVTHTLLEPKQCRRGGLLPAAAHLTSTLRAPSGVTRVAGAKAYAAKLAASPAPTAKCDTQLRPHMKRAVLQHMYTT